MRIKKSRLACEGEQSLEELLRSGFINPAALSALPEPARAELAGRAREQRLLERLVELELLTPYQADRIRSRNIQGLILGNYRVLDRLGVGSHGVVFRGEHRQTAQMVAIKVMIPACAGPMPLQRFLAEGKTVAQLSHPNIIRAIDVGESTSENPNEPVLYYYVMEHVPGVDLEHHVQRNGPMQSPLVCDVAYQIADALTEAHKHNLVHRDIKPSHVLLTPAGRAMLLDFGLVRQLDGSQTEVGNLVGMLEWIAPEQAMDARAVDIRADIYSLGCTLFWCLTAQSPHGVNGPNPRVGLAQAQKLLPPPLVRAFRPNIAPELDALVARMMAPRPDDRPGNPLAVMAALASFVSENHIPTPLRAHQDAGHDAVLAPQLVPPPPSPSVWRAGLNWLLGRKESGTP